MTRLICGLVLCLAILVAGVAPATERRAVSWGDVGDAALREEIENLVGPDAVDCGVVDISERKASDGAKRRSLDCVADAQRRGMPLKFGIRRLPLGKPAFEVYARARNGQSWLLSHGQHPEEEVAKSWMQRCMVVEVSARTLLISGMDCGKARQLGKEAE